MQIISVQDETLKHTKQNYLIVVPYTLRHDNSLYASKHKNIFTTNKTTISVPLNSLY